MCPPISMVCLVAGGGMSNADRLREDRSELVNKTIEGFPHDRSITIPLPTGSDRTIYFSQIINKTIGNFD